MEKSTLTKFITYYFNMTDSTTPAEVIVPVAPVETPIEVVATPVVATPAPEAEVVAPQA